MFFAVSETGSCAGDGWNSGMLKDTIPFPGATPSFFISDRGSTIANVLFVPNNGSAVFYVFVYEVFEDEFGTHTSIAKGVSRLDLSHYFGPPLKPARLAYVENPPASDPFVYVMLNQQEGACGVARFNKTDLVVLESPDESAVIDQSCKFLQPNSVACNLFGLDASPPFAFAVQTNNNKTKKKF